MLRNTAEILASTPRTMSQIPHAKPLVLDPHRVRAIMPQFWLHSTTKLSFFCMLLAHWINICLHSCLGNLEKLVMRCLPECNLGKPGGQGSKEGVESCKAMAVSDTCYLYIVKKNLGEHQSNSWASNADGWNRGLPFPIRPPEIVRCLNSWVVVSMPDAYSGNHALRT